MLILHKSSIKTFLLFLLFSSGSVILFAVNAGQNKQLNNNVLNSENTTISNLNIFSGKLYWLTNDTTKTEASAKADIKQEATFIIPDHLADSTFIFQVNSNISYLNFRHFALNSSKKSFYQAWSKEKELKRLSTETDSLRKVYGNSSNEGKEKIASIILKNEALAIALNQEIPALYQKTRDEEDQYWKSASPETINQFQKKISVFRDSLASIKQQKLAQISAKAQASIDTLISFQEQTKTQEQKKEASAEIVYKIQIAAYKSKIPEPANKLIKKLSIIRKVENYMDEKGVKVFTTGHLKTYQEAITLQNQIKQEGAKNPIVAAYLNGKRITVEEARKLNNEL